MTALRLLNDRFSVSFMLALLVHAAVLLLLGFRLDLDPVRKAAETLDVVLVNFRHQAAPDQADFLANAALQGGSEEAGKPEKPAAEMSAILPSLDTGDMPLTSPELPPVPAEETRELLTELQDEAPPRPDQNRVEQPDPEIPSAAQLMQQGMQAARQQPESTADQRFKSSLKRREFISANTREYEYASYMQAWVAKVERVGNLNYPVELKQRKVAGDLLLTVGINQDGSVERIDIQRGSGIPELDEAAVRIVRLAAPYSPLPGHIADRVDVLHITRTWRFSGGSRFE